MGCGAGEKIENFAYTQQRVCMPPDISGYGAFDVARDTSILIPGLAEYFVPQGIAYWMQREWLLISGYFHPLREAKAAIIFAVDAGSGALVGEFTLAKGNGEALGGHFSGIAITEQELVITQEKELYRLSLEKIPNRGKAVLEIDGEMQLSHAAGFCNYSQGVLWIGEHRNPNRQDDEERNALLVGYRISRDKEPLEICALGIPDRIQGVTLLANGKFLLAQSYGRRNASDLLVFSDPRIKAPQAQIILDGNRVPFWSLDYQCAPANFTAPPMAEGCCAVGLGAYLIFESAAYYYRAMDADNRSVHPIDTVWYLEIK